MSCVGMAVALLAVAADVGEGLQRVKVAASGAAAHDAEPPTASSILKMSGAELGAAVAKWAADADFKHKGVLFMRVSLFGAVATGTQELDAFVEAVDGQALPALINAATTLTCFEQDVSNIPPGMLVQGALTALGTLATGGSAGLEWKESAAGLSRCTHLADLGALNATVHAMNAAGLDATECAQAWDIQRAGIHVIKSVCLGHDGKEGLGLPRDATESEAMAGLPSEASLRREAATAAGAIEAIIRVFEGMRDCVKCGLKKKEARFLLDMALRALQRVTLGYEAAGSTRRARAAAAQAIPAMVGALDKVFSKDLMQQAVTTNSILMGGGDGKVDKVLDRQWQDEIAKRPLLEAKMQQVMHELYMEDPEKVRKAHEQAGVPLGDSAD